MCLTLVPGLYGSVSVLNIVIYLFDIAVIRVCYGVTCSTTFTFLYRQKYYEGVVSLSSVIQLIGKKHTLSITPGKIVRRMADASVDKY